MQLDHIPEARDNALSQSTTTDGDRVMTLALFLLQCLDDKLRVELHVGSWAIVIVMDVLIVVGIYQIVDPFPGTLGEILG